MITDAMVRISITANHLGIGDMILDGKRETQVQRLSSCTRKGVLKVHVNDNACYDTLTPLDVRRSTRIRTHLEA